MKIPFAFIAVVAALVPGVSLADDKAPATTAPAAPASAAPAQVVEELPAAVRVDMEKLVENAIQVASAPLQKSDTFPPYGVLMLNDGKYQSVIWKKPNPPPASELFRQINMAIVSESRKPEVKAAVTVAPSSVPTSDGKQRVNGIRAEVDHRNGKPRIVFIPFTRQDGKLVLGTTVYLPGTNAFFDHSAPAAEAKPAAKPAAAKPATKAPAKPAAKPATKAPAKPAAKPAATTP